MPSSKYVVESALLLELVDVVEGGLDEVDESEMVVYDEAKVSSKFPMRLVTVTVSTAAAAKAVVVARTVCVTC
jgi:hypothetical protein